MDLKQALKGDDKDIITMYAQIAYNEFGASHLTNVFNSSIKYSYSVINDVVLVFDYTGPLQSNIYIKDPTLINCKNKKN